MKEKWNFTSSFTNIWWKRNGSSSKKSGASQGKWNPNSKTYNMCASFITSTALYLFRFRNVSLHNRNIGRSTSIRNQNKQ